jgi:hypothetical protein
MVGGGCLLQLPSQHHYFAEILVDMWDSIHKVASTLHGCWLISTRNHLPWYYTIQLVQALWSSLLHLFEHIQWSRTHGRLKCSRHHCPTHSLKIHARPGFEFDQLVFAVQRIVLSFGICAIAGESFHFTGYAPLLGSLFCTELL